MAVPSDASPTPAAARVLVVCTANRCRSPMAEALMRRKHQLLGVAADVVSAGSHPGGAPASLGSVRAMARRGLDLTGHVSRKLAAKDVVAADLVLCMARRHCREVIVLHPPAWPYTFTLREFVRRAEAAGRRQPGEALDEWLRVLSEGRVLASLIADDGNDDLPDPVGGPDSAYEAAAVLIEDLVDRAVRLTFPPSS